jgi:tetratricopeptide (TPR) repeat protein
MILIKQGISLFAAVALTVTLPAVSRAQGNGISPTGTGGSHVIQGQVYLPSGRRAENIRIRLKSFGAGDLSVMSSSNGEFTFQQLAPGNYVVLIDTGDSYEGAEENVFIDTDVNLNQTGIAASTSRPYRVLIHLQPKRGAPVVKTAVINAAALADPPEPARKSYEKALDLAHAGNSKQAVENLKSAISAFPDFFLALDELGVQYLKLGQADKAVEPLTTAVKLMPDAFRPNLNLGIALLETKVFDLAESQLRTAVKLNTNSPAAHMYLGIALIGERKQGEAQAELEIAARSTAAEVAKAHYYLGGIYWGNREYSRAADELETYLKLAPKAPEATKVRETIKELRGKHQ